MTGQELDLHAAVDASAREVAAIQRPTQPTTPQVDLAPGRRRARRRRARRSGSSPNIADRIAGCLAWFDGTCPRCDEPIVSRESQVVKRREDWIHTSCAPGAVDE